MTVTDSSHKIKSLKILKSVLAGHWKGQISSFNAFCTSFFARISSVLLATKFRKVPAYLTTNIDLGLAKFINRT